MLRITEIDSTGEIVTLQLEGRIAGAWTTELRTACGLAQAEGQKLTLDLGGVSYADRDGINLIKSLASQGTMLTHCSPFLREQLKG